jgi:hypothetical protein
MFLSFLSFNKFKLIPSNFLSDFTLDRYSLLSFEPFLYFYIFYFFAFELLNLDRLMGILFFLDFDLPSVRNYLHVNDLVRMGSSFRFYEFSSSLDPENLKLKALSSEN